MLTNEQALEIIKQHDECYVVWAMDRNAIVAVHPVRQNVALEDRTDCVFGMSTDYKGPTKGRFLSSASTTLQTLIDEAAENDRVAKRVAIFNAWGRASIDDLIAVLEDADFENPMDPFHGSQFIVERLYKIHGPALTGEQISRLEEFAQSKDIHAEQAMAQENLQCYLCVLANDVDRLNALWERYRRDDAPWSHWSALVESAGDLPTRDSDIIATLICFVERPGMFSPRFEAMGALGKIGAPAGAKAARAIRENIYESESYVTDVRNRVLERIESPPPQWSKCASCFHGYVSGFSYGSLGVESCETCLGLGWIRNVRETPD